MSAYARVDLPDPFGPMTACTSFRSTSRSTPLTISVPSSSATCRFSNLSNATRYASFPENSGAFAPPDQPQPSLAEGSPRTSAHKPGGLRATLRDVGYFQTPWHIVLLLLIALLLFGEIGRAH